MYNKIQTQCLLNFQDLGTFQNNNMAFLRQQSNMASFQCSTWLHIRYIESIAGRRSFRSDDVTIVALRLSARPHSLESLVSELHFFLFSSQLKITLKAKGFNTSLLNFFLFLFKVHSWQWWVYSSFKALDIYLHKNWRLFHYVSQNFTSIESYLNLANTNPQRKQLWDRNKKKTFSRHINNAHTVQSLSIKARSRLYLLWFGKTSRVGNRNKWPFYSASFTTYGSTIWQDINVSDIEDQWLKINICFIVTHRRAD